jgi:hypothetical protein
VDLGSGFLIMPEAILAAPVEVPVVTPDRQPSPGPLPGPHVPGGAPTPAAPAPTPAKKTSVSIEFTADRNQLFTAWNAMANLADQAGKVKVTVSAASDNGFDQSKLENGVLEPLRETGLID